MLTSCEEVPDDSFHVSCEFVANLIAASPVFFESINNTEWPWPEAISDFILTVDTLSITSRVYAGVKVPIPTLPKS